MKAALLVSTLLVLILIFLKFGNLNQPKNETTQESTIVIDYKQEIIPESKKEGSCWTTSIAAQSNNKAWRCSVENNVYDPCFEADNKKVICDVNPEDPTRGFELILTEALPLELVHNSNDVIWMTKLENGLKCSLITGTSGTLNGKDFYYACNNGGVLLGNFGKTFDTSSDFWKAQLAYQDENFEQKGDTEFINVLMAWK